MPRGAVFDASVAENENFVRETDAVETQIACFNRYSAYPIAKLSLITKISFQSTVFAYPVEPCDYGVDVFVITASLRKFLKKPFKLREFFLIKKHAIEVYSVMFFNQFDGVFLRHT